MFLKINNEVSANWINIQKIIHPKQLRFNEDAQHWFNIWKWNKAIHPPFMNRTKNNNHVITSIKAEKVFAKINIHEYILMYINDLI